MADVRYAKRQNSNDDWKPKIFLACHPDDVEEYQESLIKTLLDIADCEVWYAEDPNERWNFDDLNNFISQMNVIVVPVTSLFLHKDNEARSVILPMAINECKIPVLPINEEYRIECEFMPIYGDRPYISSGYAFQNPALDNNYEYLNKTLTSILVSDEEINGVLSLIRGENMDEFTKEYFIGLANLYGIKVKKINRYEGVLSVEYAASQGLGIAMKKAAAINRYGIGTEIDVMRSLQWQTKYAHYCYESFLSARCTETACEFLAAMEDLECDEREAGRLEASYTCCMNELNFYNMTKAENGPLEIKRNYIKLFRRMADILTSLEGDNFSDALSFADCAIDLAQDLYLNVTRDVYDNLEVEKGYYIKGHVYQVFGDYNNAVNWYIKAVNLGNDIFNLQPTLFAVETQAHDIMAIADLYSACGLYDNARICYENERFLMERIYQIEKTDEALSEILAATILTASMEINLGNLDKVVRIYRDTLPQLEKLVEKTDSGPIRMRLASGYRALGNIDFDGIDETSNLKQRQEALLIAEHHLKGKISKRSYVYKPSLNLLSNVYHDLSEICEKLGQMETADTYRGLSERYKEEAQK